MISYGLLCLALTTATLPNVAELKPGQLPLLMAIVGCAVLLIGVATEALRTRRQEMDQVVQALRTRSAELARAANRMAALQEHERRRIGPVPHDPLGQAITANPDRLRTAPTTPPNPPPPQRLSRARTPAPPPPAP